MKLSVIVAAAGKGLRMGGDTPKQYLPVNGKPVLQHTLERMLAIPADDVVLVVPADDEMYSAVPAHRCCRIVRGGDSRRESVLNGLYAIQAEDTDWIMVHDGVRPCVRHDDVLRLIQTVGDDDIGGLLAIPVVETVKRSGEGGRVLATEKRENLWLAQTPQLFRYGVLLRAMQDAADAAVTDEASALEVSGARPLLVAGSRDNIKVTTSSDLQMASMYLAQQAREVTGG